MRGSFSSRILTALLPLFLAHLSSCAYNTVDSADIASVGTGSFQGNSVGNSVGLNENLVINFNSALLVSSINNSSAYITHGSGSSSTLHAASLAASYRPTACNIANRIDTTVSTTGRQISLDPAETLTCDTTYNICLTSAIEFKNGAPFSGSTYTFTTESCDLTSPTVSSFTPASSIVATLPSTATLTMSSDLLGSTVDASDFSLGGTCTGQSVTVNSVVAGVITLGLTATCADTQTFTVSFDPAAVTDSSTNVGTGATVSRTYTIDSIGPTPTLAAPSTTGPVSSSNPAVTIGVSYSEAISGTLSSSEVTVTTATGTATCATVTITSGSSQTPIINLSNCTGSGTVTATINAAAVTDVYGNASTVSAASASITVDNTSPTLSSFTPASATLSALPATATITLSSDLLAGSVTSGDFSLSGTCTGKAVSVLSVSMGVITLGVGGTCANGQTFTISFDPANVTDDAGNVGTGGSVSRTYVVDSSGPIPTLAAPSTTGPVNSSASAVTIGVTYNETISGTLSNSEVTVNTVSGTATCGTVSITSGSSQTPTINISNCTGTGTVTATINAAAVVDAVGNNSVASSASSVISVDNTPPTVSTFTPATATVQAISSSATIVTSSDLLAGSVTAGDFSLSGTCTSKVVTVNSILNGIITLGLSATCADGDTFIISLDPTNITDTSGNPATGSVVTRTYTIDGAGPVVTLGVPSTTGPLNSTASAFTIGVSYSETVAGTLLNSEVTVAATSGTAACGTISITSGSSQTPTINISNCTGTGTVTAQVNASAVTDAVGNGNIVSSASAIINVDNTAPTISSFTAASATFAALPVTATITMSSDLLVSSVSISDFSLSGTCTSKSVTVNSVSSGVITLGLIGTCADTQTFTISFDPVSVTDAALNAGSGSSVSRTYTIDSASPIPTLAAPSTTGPINSAAADVTIGVTYNETISGTLDNTEITVNTASGTATCGTVSITSGSGQTPTINLSNCTGTGTVTAQVNSSAVTDVVGNASVASSASTAINIDNTAPTVSTFTPATSTVGTLPATATITMSSDLLAGSVASGDFSIGGTCTGTSVTVNSVVTGVITLGLTGTCADTQTFILSFDPSNVTDTALNAGSGGSVSRTYTIDAAGPVPTLAAPSTTGPINSAAAAVTIGVTYNETISGTLLNSEITVNTASGTATCGTVSITSGSSQTPTINISNCTGTGTVAVQVNASAVTDAYSNNSVASAASTAINIDNTGPTVSTFTPATSTVGSLPATATITMSSDLLGSSVVDTDFSLSGTCTGKSVTVDSVVAGVITLGLTGTCADTQTFTVSLDPSNVTDTALNAGTGGAESRTYTIDSAGPIPSLAAPSSTGPINSAAADVTIDVTYNETVSGTLLNSEITVNTASGTATCGTVSITNGSSQTPTINLSNCTGTGTVTAQVNASAVTDAYSNNSVVSAASSAITIDNTAPTISTFTPATSTVGSLPATATITMSSDLLAGSVTAGDFSLSGTCTGKSVTVDSVVAGVITLGLTGTCADTQTFTVSLDPSNVTDTALNAGSGSAVSRTYTIDSSGPSLVSVSPDTSARVTLPTVTITLDQAVDPASVDVSDFGIGGTCTGTSVTVDSASGTVITITLLGTCADQQTFVLSFNTSSFQDIYGNNGTSSSTNYTYTKGYFRQTRLIEGTQDFEHLGTAVTFIGDIDSDGRDDYIIGSPDLDGAGTARGRATVYSGVNASVIFVINGAIDNENLGQVISAAGDFDHDGTPDFMIGEPLYGGTGRVIIFSGADAG